MEELAVKPELVGTKVRSAARPEWGLGTVLRVQQVRSGDSSAHRVSVQFTVGNKTLLIPPAKLLAPAPEPQRVAGWLEGLGKTTLDDRLRGLPERVTHVLGTPYERLAAVIPLYALADDSPTLLRWAISQTGVTDPLSQWTRDELVDALQYFCNERDAFLRNIVAIIKQKDGSDAVRELVEQLPVTLRESVRTALTRLI